MHTLEAFICSKAIIEFEKYLNKIPLVLVSFSLSVWHIFEDLEMICLASQDTLEVVCVTESLMVSQLG